MRFGTCKRSAERLPGAIATLGSNVERFLTAFPRYRTWTIEQAVFAPTVSLQLRGQLEAKGAVVQDLEDLTQGL